MATHKSAIKRHKQSEERRIRNTSVNTAIKNTIKKVRNSVEKANAEEAAGHLKAAVSLLDRAVTKGVLHKNNASRRISRLTKHVRAIGSK